jgi:hypothetical protein
MPARRRPWARAAEPRAGGIHHRPEPVPHRSDQGGYAWSRDENFTNHSALFYRLHLGRQRTIIDALMTITINPVSRGSKIFDPNAIDVAWKEDLS